MNFKGNVLFVPPIFSPMLGGQSKVFRNEKEPANIQVLFNKSGENIRYAETLSARQKFIYGRPWPSNSLNA